MVHELRVTPFYRPNTLAMLNTLFPPSIRDLPNHLVNLRMMSKYRATFYEYVGAVGREGSRVLDPFVEKMGPGGTHSWESVRACLESYFKKAKKIMDQANEPDGISYTRVRDSSSGETNTSSGDYTTSECPKSASSAASSVEHIVSSSYYKPLLTEESGIWRMAYQAPKHETSKDSGMISSLRQCGGQAKIPRPKNETVKTSTVIVPPRSAAAGSTPVTPGLCIPHEAFTRLPDPNIDDNTQPTQNSTKRSYGKRTTIFEVGPDLDSPIWEGRYVTMLVPAPDSSFHPPVVRTPTDEIHDSGTSPFPPLYPGSAVPGTARLPSDNFDFLNRPYEELPSPDLPRLRKMSSIKNFFHRKKSTTTLREDYLVDNALGIKLSGRSQTPDTARLVKQNSHGTERITPTPRKGSGRSTPFTPRSDKDAQKTVRKAKSFGELFRRNKRREDNSEEESEEEEEQIRILPPLPDPNTPCSCCPDGGQAFRNGIYPSIACRPSETIPRPQTSDGLNNTENNISQESAFRPSIRHATSAPVLRRFPASHPAPQPAPQPTPRPAPSRPSAEPKQVKFSILPSRDDAEDRGVGESLSVSRRDSHPEEHEQELKGKSIMKESTYSPILNSTEFIERGERRLALIDFLNQPEPEQPPLQPPKEEKVVKKKSLKFWKKEKPEEASTPEAPPMPRPFTPTERQGTGFFHRHVEPKEPERLVLENNHIKPTQATPDLQASFENKQRRRAAKEAWNQQFVRKDVPLADYIAKHKRSSPEDRQPTLPFGTTQERNPSIHEQFERELEERKTFRPHHRPHTPMERHETIPYNHILRSKTHEGAERHGERSNTFRRRPHAPLERQGTYPFSHAAESRKYEQFERQSEGGNAFRPNYRPQTPSKAESSYQFTPNAKPHEQFDKQGEGINAFQSNPLLRTPSEPQRYYNFGHTVDSNVHEQFHRQGEGSNTCKAIRRGHAPLERQGTYPLYHNGAPMRRRFEIDDDEMYN
jgi:hypothetical protein